MDVSAYRLIEGASGAILRQGTIERVLYCTVGVVTTLTVQYTASRPCMWHLSLFLSDVVRMAFIISFPGVL
jgi:hypothetical protein